MEFIDILYLFFFGVMIFSSVLWLLIYTFNREEVHEEQKICEDYSVTFLVPAYNEEKYIEDTLEALIRQDYPKDKMEIIAINDGSTDSTLEKMKEYSDRITIIDKENTGKADSLNTALDKVDTDLVVSMDADSYPKEEFLKKMVGKFHSSGERMGGVTPALKLRRVSGWVEKIQWTEYIFQIFLRKVFALFNVQYVLPGPGSLYRAEYLKDTGGWREDTFTEDMEVAFRMANDGYSIENLSDAVVYTDPPSTLKGLFAQRIRWYRGYIQNMFRYIEMFGNPGYGNIGFFLMPLNIFWVFMMMFFFLHSGYNVLDVLWSWFNTYMLLGYLPLNFNLFIQRIHFFHIFLGFFLFLGVATILISLKVADEEVRLWERKAHYTSFFVLYPFLFAMFWVAAVIEHIRGGKGQW